MRGLIALTTVLGVIGLGTLEADVPKKLDASKSITSLKNSRSARDRVEAAEEIGRIGSIRASAVKDAIEPLLSALKGDSDAGVRAAAAKALGMIAPDAETTVPVLTEALRDKAMNVKAAAAGALGQYGAEARSALPALRELASNKDKKEKKLSQAARMAIKSIAGKKK